MARRRYIVVRDATNPLLLVDRYLANGSINQRTSGLAARRTNPASTSPTVAELIAEQSALTARLAATNLFSPAAWAVESVAAVESGAFNARFREFLSAPHRDTYQFVLCADREEALAALARARSLSMAQIGAMEPGPQAEAVRAMWQNFNDYFVALGIDVRAWAKYRNAWEHAVGSQSGDGIAPFLQSTATGVFPRGYDLMFTERPRGGVPASPTEVAAVSNALATTPEPTPPWSPAVIAAIEAMQPGTRISSPTADSPVVRSLARGAVTQSIYRNLSTPTTPSWREMAVQRAQAIFGGDRSGAILTFGSPNETNASSQLGTGEHPVNDAFRLAIADGRLATSSATPQDFDRLDCVPRNAVGAADGTTGGLPAPKPGFNWMCGAITIDRSGRVYYYAPLIWYAQLLRPLLDYLATRDPLEIAYEVSIDAGGKNLWTVIATGRAESALNALGLATAMSNYHDVSENASQRSFNTTASTILAGAAMVVPMAAAIGGAAVAGFNLFAQATQAPMVIPRGDAFHRIEPVVEYIQLARGTSAYQCGDTSGESVTIQYHTNDVYVPPRGIAQRVGAMGTVSDLGGATPSSTLANVAPSELMVVGMPHYGTVFIDDVPQGDGHWNDAELTQWIVPLPEGEHTVRVQPPNGGTDVFARAVGAHGVTALRYADMRTAAQIQHGSMADVTLNGTTQPTPARMWPWVIVGTLLVGGVAAYVYRDEIADAL